MLCQKLDFVAEMNFVVQSLSNVSITIEKLISYECDNSVVID